MINPARAKNPQHEECRPSLSPSLVGFSPDASDILQFRARERYASHKWFPPRQVASPRPKKKKKKLSFLIHLLTTVPSSSATLKVPDPMQAFNTQIKFDRTQPLSKVEMWINCIEFMAFLAGEAYEGSLQRPITMYGHQFGSLIEETPLPLTRRSQLRFKYLVQGVYEIGLAIAVNDSWYRLFCGLYLGGQKIGFIGLKRRGSSGSRIKSNTTTIVATDVSRVQRDSSSSLSTSGKGTVVDPSDRKFSVDYQLDPPQIQPASIFVAFLDGLANAAPHNRDDTGATVSGYGASNECILHLAEGDHPGTLSWLRLTRFIQIIWQQLMIGHGLPDGHAFQSMEFQLKYDGEEIGKGFILKEEGLGRMTTSKRDLQTQGLVN